MTAVHMTARNEPHMRAHAARSQHNVFCGSRPVHACRLAPMLIYKLQLDLSSDKKQ